MPAPKPLPPLEVLEARFRYNPESGHLFYVSPPSPRHASLVGKRAGSAKGADYRKISIGGEEFLEHRIIWKLATGEEPPEVDHRNGVRYDNRKENLRASWEKEQNGANLPEEARGASGIKGVRFCKFKNLFIAEVGHRGRKHCRSFETAEEASLWRVVKTIELNGEWTRAELPPGMSWDEALKALAPRQKATNTSGVTGVSFHSCSGLWCAHIKSGGISRTKYFRTKEAAVAQRQRWEALRVVELGL
jgi:hypothetical protein